jgi:flagellar hook-associated protein 2
MSTVSFTGLATGMDTATIVSQLVELKREPIYRLQRQRSSYETQLSALGTLKARLTALQDAAKAIDTSNEFAALVGASSNENVVRVTAGSESAPGSYDIVVTALAQAQKSRSQGYDNTLVDMGLGTLAFTVGGELQELELSEYTNLQELAERINTEIDGVSASIINDGSATGGYSLVLTGDAGTGGAFSVDSSGLSGGQPPSFSELQTATDAQLSVDGIAITASGNHLENVISGLTLDLEGVSADPGSPTRIEVSTDFEGVQEQVKAFIDAYNELFTFIETEMMADGKLEGNPTTRSVANRMENLMSAAHGGDGAFSILAQIGIERQQSTRTLSFDESAFAAALADNYTAVRDLFIERNGSVGKASLINTAVDELTDSIDGIFKIGTDSLNRRIDNIDDTIVRYERSVDNYRTTLERKFLAMESTVSLLQAQGSYLASMMIQS